MTATLELLYEGKPILVQQDEVTLGRVQSCSVRVVHPLVSRQHCRLLVSGEGVLVEDLGSSNGTYLNGLKVEGRQRVQGGDQISLGREGATLILVRADWDGVEVTGDSEEDRATMLPGDPRAQAVMARISIASEVLPELGELEELPDSGLYDEGYVDYDDEDSQTEEPPTDLVDDRYDATQQSATASTEPAVAPGTQPAAPTQPPAQGGDTQPILLEQDARQQTMPVHETPPSSGASPGASHSRASAAGGPSRRLVTGLLIGFGFGLVIILIVALATDLPARLGALFGGE